MSSIFGSMFSVTTFGESHGTGVGAVVDGCPARLVVRLSDIQAQLDRRRPGQSELTTQRDERDMVEILSGIENDRTLGTPIGLLVRNHDQRPDDYRSMGAIPRPSHADFTYRVKYGEGPRSGGGRASARETIGRVAAGAIAERLLMENYGITIVAWVSSVGTVQAPDLTADALSRAEVDRHIVRCPDRATAERMAEAIRTVRDAGDSLGGIITGVCRNVPAGWGEPVFDKLHARLAHAMMSIPAVKGFEVGSGFAGTAMKGSQHNDLFIGKAGTLGTVTNRSGGIQGGISNGEPIVFRVAFKPTATISRDQSTADYAGRTVVLSATGRHDPCVLPRAVPIVESMAALVLADAALQAHARVI